MSNHQATEQMMGYLYQVRFALALLLENDNPDYRISIEKFDDVAFEKDGHPVQLIQVKHHIQHTGNLSDGSTDLWRTLKVWIDTISDNPDRIIGTEFLIITTATAPKDTAASCLKKSVNRDPEEAYYRLKQVCTESKNKAHQKYYSTFLKTDEVLLKQLMKQIYVIDGEKNICDVEKVLRKQIRYSCAPQYEDFVCERLEGWWFKKSIEALCSEVPIFVTQRQIRSVIVSMSQEYSDDNLPIDEILVNEDIQESDLSDNEKVFYEQLKLICLGNRHIKIALRDYYRAFKQRASWVRNDLLYINELEKYEERLVDEWEHSFATMEDKLAKDECVTEAKKVEAGSNLLSEIEAKDIRIREKCREPFVMRGSYHMLANQLKVGWHVDFYMRLKDLLNT